MTVVAAPVSPSFDRSAATTRALLGYGVLAGPFYLVVGIAQGLLRPGFSFARHPLSVLASGAYGWIQSANFALSGLMVIAAAIGVSRATGRPGRASAWVLGVYGLGVALATLFPADAMDGFPVGTPLGPPTQISTTGAVHFAIGALSFVTFAVAALLAARMLQRTGARRMAVISAASGVVMLLGFFGGFALPSPVAGIWITVVVGWCWLAGFSLHLYHRAPSPNCEPAAT